MLVVAGHASLRAKMTVSGVLSWLEPVLRGQQEAACAVDSAGIAWEVNTAARVGVENDSWPAL